MITLIVVIVCLGICLYLYNSLISKKNQIENASGGLDAQLKQRYDLIPNLISSIKVYMQHESETLEKLTQLRITAMKNGLSNEIKQNINQEISQGLARIMVVSEGYPDLKSNTNFIELQKTLFNVEENISASRRFYNASVTEYNDAIEMFPSSIFARIMNLKRKEVFSIPEIERKNANVAELFKK